MTPMLGIMASSISGSKAVTTAYESIATTTVGSGGTANITFSSIPATYKHLQIRGISRSNGAADNTVIQFNSDTANNYATHYLLGNGTTASAGAETTRARFYVDILASNASGAMWSGDVIDILDYANTNKYKTVRALAGQDLNGSGTVWLASGLWQSTAAITSIKIYLNGAVNLAQYSSFALYGIKG
jgi:hypothetical protein